MREVTDGQGEDSLAKRSNVNEEETDIENELLMKI
jgi:hypothetical protein